MEELSPRPGDLEAIETASRDEIATLQLGRMVSPTRSSSFAQVEKQPPSTRLMPTRNVPSCRPEQIE